MPMKVHSLGGEPGQPRSPPSQGDKGAGVVDDERLVRGTSSTMVPTVGHQF